MNCFVIMPFSEEFDDVYATIKASVANVVQPPDGRCFRLDETRPAGPITNRLLTELRSASLCVADLTGNNPNVMWEVGYAMAWGCPTIIVTQRLSELPFDIRDMQSLQYSRAQLTKTLGEPLERMVTDTLTANAKRATPPNRDSEVFGGLLAEVQDLKLIVSQAVESWNSERNRSAEAQADCDSLAALQGSWIDLESYTHVYASIIGKELVAPYSFAGNKDLTGVFYGWRKTGEHWFARFAWLEGETSGFNFMRFENPNLMRGAWWLDRTFKPTDPEVPPKRSGVTSVWERSTEAFPVWADRFLDDVRQKGLQSLLPEASVLWI